MSIDSYLTYLLATAIILVTPGPTIVLVVSQAATHGRRSVIPLAAGVLLGDFTAMTFSLLGLGAILSASSILFSMFKWVGACYLCYLGIQLWRKKTVTKDNQLLPANKKALSLFQDSFVVTALNPKSIAFFAAFLPQFIVPNSPVFPQMVVLGLTFLTMAVINAALYGFFAGQLHHSISDQKNINVLNKIGGTALIGAAVATASAVQKSVR